MPTRVTPFLTGSGIGREVARCLSRQGCRLILWDINEAGNNETRDMIIETGSEAYTYTVDVSNRHQVYATADKVNFWIIEQNIACYCLVSACLIRRTRM